MSSKHRKFRCMRRSTTSDSLRFCIIMAASDTVGLREFALPTLFPGPFRAMRKSAQLQRIPLHTQQ